MSEGVVASPFLQQHRTDKCINGTSPGVTHTLEALEHKPALWENCEEVEHGGSEKAAAWLELGI